MRGIVSWIIVALLLIGTLTLAFDVGMVHAQGETVYINSDGSISPSSAPITSVDNVTYAFQGNMSYPTYNGIIVERGNIVINGNGYMVQGNNKGNGLSLTDINNATIQNTNIENFAYGIYIENSNSNTISRNNAKANSIGIFLGASSNSNIVNANTATANAVGIILNSSSSNHVIYNTATANSHDGIDIDGSSNNTIVWNTATAKFDGIDIDGSSNNTVSWNTATANSIGIVLNYSSDNTLLNNNVTNNYDGIGLDTAYSNTLSGNNVAANTNYGILLNSSSNNVLSDNNVTNSEYGIEPGSPNNFIFHNNFVDNTNQVLTGFLANIWDDGYPSGGNYWSDYNGTDLKSGPYQNVTGSDGIGDTPYVINANNTDNYPLMGMFSDFNFVEGVDVQIVSNSTISDFQFNTNAMGTVNAILFNVSSTNGTTGFCNVCVPSALLNGTLTVQVNGTQVQYSLLPSSNSNSSYLYFTYSHSTEQVTIVPEFPEFLILAMFMLATLSTIAIYKKRHSCSARAKEATYDGISG